MQLDNIEEEISGLIDKGELSAVQAIFAKHPEYVGRRYRNCISWLSIAAQGRHLDIAKAILVMGCDVDLGSWSSGIETPLWVAVGKDDLPMVRLLLEHGADPNRGRMVITAVTGMKQNSLEMIKLLEQYGADLHRVFINEQSKQPMNALSSAIAWGKEDVAEYLRSKGATLPPPLPTKPSAPSLADEVIAYFADNFGPVDAKSLIEIVPTALPPIAIHTIPPAKDRNHITLFTTGMSDEPMTVPTGEEDYRFAEIFVQLPANWNTTDLGNAAHRWPLDWLRLSAQNPHVNGSWLGGPIAIIANEDPPRPLGPGTKFTCVLLMAQQSFMSRKGKKIQLYRMMPLYTEERDMEKREGTPALMLAFDRHDVGFVVDPNRRNVGK